MAQKENVQEGAKAGPSRVCATRENVEISNICEPKRNATVCGVML